MKMGHFEMVTTLLAAMILVDIFQVKAEVLDMAEDAFDDEYLKCTSRMEMKYVPQLLREEKSSDKLLQTVWDNAEIKWEARKAQILPPDNFKDTYGIALMALVTEAREQTPFYDTFSSAVRKAGQSRKRYIYDFPYKALHFYLVRAMQLLRPPCENNYKNAVYSTNPNISFSFGKQTKARLGNFTLAYRAKPSTADNHQVLTIHTCFGVSVEKFFDKESEGIVLVPLSEVFQVSQEGTHRNLTLQSINQTCSYYECAFLGGLKTENCIANPESTEPVYVFNPDLDNQKLEESGRKNLESTGIPEHKSQGNADNPSPGAGPGPVPRPKTHPSASSGKMVLPSVTAAIILMVTSAVNSIAL